MKLFAIENFSHPPFIILRLSGNCSGNCEFCFRGIKSSYKDNEFYQFLDYENIFKFIGKAFDKKYTILFLGRNIFDDVNLENVENILSYYSKGARKILFQTSYRDIKNNIQNITLLKSRYKLNLLFDLNVYEEGDMRELFSMSKVSNLEISIYVSLDFSDKFYPFLLKYYLPYSHSGDSIININSNTISFINRKNARVENNECKNLYYDSCIVNSSLKVTDEEVFLSEGIEITREGDIKFHMNSYCSKGIKKVSSIFRDQRSIFKDFSKFKKYINTYDKGKLTMEEKCFNCIRNPYTVD